MKRMIVVQKTPNLKRRHLVPIIEMIHFSKKRKHQNNPLSQYVGGRKGQQLYVEP